MPILLSYPLFHADDDNGAPLTGGLLYSYIAGTSTPKATYSNKAFSVANANPVVLDSRGEATVYLSGGYKLALKSSVGADIWEMDGIDGGEDQYVFYPSSSESDHGVASTGWTLYDILTLVGTTKKATVKFLHNGSSSTTTFTVTTAMDLTAYSNISFRFERGALIGGTGNVIWPSQGTVIAGPWQIFTGSGTQTFASGGGIAYDEWDGSGTGLALYAGAYVNEFSIDGTLADNSDSAVPTEKAVKTYVGANAALTGSYLFWSTSTPPSGYLECNGASLNRTTYANLFAVIGVIYGNVDGNTFNIPDWRGRFPRAWANGSANDPDRTTRTDRGDGTTGDNIGTKQADAFESHQHTGTVSSAQAGITTILQYAGGGSVFSGTIITDLTGGNETRSINMNLMICIKY